MTAMPRRVPRLLGVALAISGSLSFTGSAGASQVSALQRIRASAHITEARGSAHFVNDTSISGSSPSQHISSTGDAQFPGPNVSLVIRVTSSSSSNSPVSRQIEIGRDFYTKYVSPTGAPGLWSKGHTRQPYPYLGVIEPVTLTNYRGPVKVVGSSKAMNGDAATEYALPFPSERHVLPLPESKSQTISVSPFTLDVWLNPAGQIVRTSAVLIEKDNGTTVVSRTTVTLSQFGKSVHIAAPKAIAHS